MMTVINHEHDGERKCEMCPFFKNIIMHEKHTYCIGSTCVACDTKEAEEWGKTHDCPLN